MGIIDDIVDAAKNISQDILNGLSSGVRDIMEEARETSRAVVKFGDAVLDAPGKPPEKILNYYQRRGYTYHASLDAGGLCAAISAIGIVGSAVLFLAPPVGTAAAIAIGAVSTLVGVGCLLGALVEEVSKEYGLDCGNVGVFVFVNWITASVELYPYCTS